MYKIKTYISLEIYGGWFFKKRAHDLPIEAKTFSSKWSLLGIVPNIIHITSDMFFPS